MASLLDNIAFHGQDYIGICYNIQQVFIGTVRMLPKFKGHTASSW